MISWGSFLLGGIVFSPFFIMFGFIMGILSSTRKFKNLNKDLLHCKVTPEKITYSCQGKYATDDDFDEEDFTIVDQNWRDQ